MAYADVDSVNAYLVNWGFQATALTSPTATQVTEWVTGFEALINQYLKRLGYDVPATGTNDVALLKDISSKAIAYRVWTTIYHDAKIDSTVQSWIESVNMVIEDMKDGNFLLVDVIDSAGSDGTTIGVTIMKVLPDANN